MSPYRKSALLLVRLVAFGCLIFSLLQLGAYVMLKQAGKPLPDSPLMMSLKLLPLLVGLVLLVKGSAIARKLTEDFEE